MLLRYFAVPPEGGELMEEFEEFLRSHRVLGVEKTYVAEAKLWMIWVKYQEERRESSARGSRFESASKKGMVDYQKVLGAEDFARYDRLRRWRKRRGEELNILVYEIFNNEQLALMIQNRVRTKQALSDIPGIGVARLERYSDDVLKELEAIWAEDASLSGGQGTKPPKPRSEQNGKKAEQNGKKAEQNGKKAEQDDGPPF